MRLRPEGEQVSKAKGGRGLAGDEAGEVGRSQPHRAFWDTLSSDWCFTLKSMGSHQKVLKS